jgi:PurA ssDNA and RNA-binding protein
MISNERPSPFGFRPYSQPKPPVQEDTLKSDKIQIERKTFVFTLKENPRGRFLRITEDVGGRRDTIIIPSTGLEDFKKLLEDMVKTSNEIPLKDSPPPEAT